MSETKQESGPPQIEIERIGNIATITTPDGKYSIAYGLHPVTGKYVVPEGVDGFGFEWTGAKDFEGYGVKEAAAPNQKPLFDYAAQAGLPLLTTDCSKPPRASENEEIISILEFGMAGCLFYKTYKEAVMRKISRRHFLNMIFYGTSALYLALPFASSHARIGSFLTGAGEGETAEISKFTQKIHPEYKIITLAMRDAVAAQKMQFLSRYNSYRHILTARGAEHVGLETAIMSKETERIDYLTRLGPLLPNLIPYPETFYQIDEYRLSRSDKWSWEVVRTLEEPTLKRIILS